MSNLKSSSICEVNAINLLNLKAEIIILEKMLCTAQGLEMSDKAIIADACATLRELSD